MYLHQIIIHGFKSYKDQTVMDPFSPGHNVIVGRNGSGKSNLFWAIRFALNDAYSSLSKEERQSLLHEGSGPASMSAFVEIVFDNADLRFPTGNDQVVLRRTIGLKKDEFSLDRKSATKAEVMALLESAGFSSANPYYIVPQGRITALCHSKDADRLQLLKDVAGTGVYESRRAEALKILDETSGKREKIDQLMLFINERLNELNEEKHDLVEFNRLDRDRRALEYTLYHRELSATSSELESTEANRLAHLHAAHQDRDSIQSLLQQLDLAIENVAQARQQLDNVSIDRESAVANVESVARNLTEIQLVIAETELANQDNQNDDLQSDLSLLTAQITELQQFLSVQEPELDSAKTKLESLDTVFDELQARRQALAAKQGRMGQFDSIRQYHTFLNREIKQLNDLVVKEQARLSEVELEEESLAHEYAHVEEYANKIQTQFADAQSHAGEIQANFNRAQKIRDDLNLKRKAAWSDESKAQSALDTARRHIEKLQNQLMSACDKGTAGGLKALQEIVHRAKLEGVHGPLYELMDVPSEYRVAVEVVGSTSIFQVVVDNDETAALVLQELKNGHHPGARLTLLPLNRLRVKHTQTPDDNRVIPMISKIHFEPIYQTAFVQIYGRAVICPDLETASMISKSSGLSAVTLQGDRVDRKGAMSGGFLDRSRSRLEAALELGAAKKNLAKAQQAFNKAREVLDTLDQEITRAVSDMHRIEDEQRNVQDDAILLEWQAKRQQMTNLQAARQLVRDRGHKLRNDIHAHQLQVQNLEKERDDGGSGSSGISDLEETELQEIERLITNNRTESSAIQQQVSDLQQKVTETRSQLDNFLLPKQMSLQRDMLVKEQSLCKYDINVLNRQLKALKKELKDAQNKVKEIEAQFEETKTMVETSESQVEKLRSDVGDRQRALDSQDITMSRYISARKLLVDKRDDVVRRIRDLGYIISEENQNRYLNVGQTELVKLLKQVTEQLKQYSHVNKKANEQFLNFTKQQESLTQRKLELQESETHIRKLMASLDKNKDDSIRRTYSQVSQNFARVFQELVVLGRGKLVLVKKDGTEIDNFDEEDEEGLVEDVFHGISIHVSFNSQVDEGLHMGQLSGGQKSLVALTLIFAIQQCDPAPFYLFDEIDANLDAQFRDAIASKIHNLAEHAQFITTTFRPELLAHANQYYGVSFKDKASKIQCITRDDAYSFVELGNTNPVDVQ